jgi:WD40 repeat protein
VRTHRQLGQPLGGAVSAVDSIAFSPDGGTLVSGGGDGRVRFWDVRTRRQLGRPLQRYSEPRDVLSVAFSADGRIVAAGTYQDDTARVWDVRTHRELGSPLKGDIVAFSRKGHILASASNTSILPSTSRLNNGGWEVTLQLWDARTHRPIGGPLLGETSRINSLAFSPNGRILASASGDIDFDNGKAIRFWDVRTHTQLMPPIRG